MTKNINHKETYKQTPTHFYVLGVCYLKHLNQMQIITLTPNDVNITVKCETEDISAHKHFSYLNDNENEVKKTVKRIEKKLESNPWAWCSVNITCSYYSLVAETYLGCCSYKNANDFIKNSGQYDQMVAECIADLQNLLNEIVIAATS